MTELMWFIIGAAAGILCTCLAAINREDDDED